MKKLFTLITFLTLGTVFAQVKHDVGDFNQLKVSDKIPVKLVKSSKNQIEVSGDKAEDVVYVNNNSQLKIRMKTANLLQGDETEVILYFKNIEDINGVDGAKIRSEEPFKQPKLTLKANKGATIELEVDLKKLEVTANSGGKVILNGSADNQNIVANSGGFYDGKKVKTKQTDVKVRAGGEAVVTASDMVEAKTQAGGKIDVFGNAEVNEERVLGGTVDVHRE